jgi:hypothetical protein
VKNNKANKFLGERKKKALERTRAKVLRQKQVWPVIGRKRIQYG